MLRRKSLAAALFILTVSFFMGPNGLRAADQCWDMPSLSGNYEYPQDWYSGPLILTSSETVSRDNYVDVWLDPEEWGHPPFQWTVSGTGFYFEEAPGPTFLTTHSDSEIIALWADDTACGAATISVTDARGETDTAVVRSSAGRWVLVHEEDCGEVELVPGNGNCSNCTTVVVGGYRYQDCWWGGTNTYRYDGPYCEKWPYTEDLSDTKCSAVGFYFPFGVVGLLDHNMWEWQCY
jgi:hypothetical protein